MAHSHRKLKIAATVLVTLLFVLPVGSCQALYFYGLHRVGELPQAPAVQSDIVLVSRAIWTQVEAHPQDDAPLHFAVKPIWMIWSYVYRRTEHHDMYWPGKGAANSFARIWLLEKGWRKERATVRQLLRASLALWLTRHFSAPQLTQAIANRAYFGRGMYGVDEAAESYFRKNPAQLRPHEAAFLAVLMDAPSILPSRYDPSRSLAIVCEGRNRILKQFYQAGTISPADYEMESKLALEYFSSVGRECTDSVPEQSNTLEDFP